MKKILLTIIIPSYNSCKTIAKTLDSVFQYSLSNTEVIVMDGKSTDGTGEVLRKYSDQIDVIVSEKDRGLSDALNKGLEISHGEWIFVLAADDVLINNPEKILRRYSDCAADLICGNIIINKGDNHYWIDKSEKDLSKLKKHCSIRHPATFFRKSSLVKSGKYDLNYKIAMDYDMFLRMYYLKYNFKFIDVCVVIFSLGGLSTNERTENITAFETFAIRKHYLKGRDLMITKLKEIKYKMKKKAKAFLKSLKINEKKSMHENTIGSKLMTYNEIQRYINVI